MDALIESSQSYEKSAELADKLNDKYAASKALGKAAQNYTSVKELINDRKFLYKAADVYHKAALALYDIGVNLKEKGELRHAYVIIGDMGDAYLSIAMLYEEEDIDLAAENYFYAAESYRESGILSRRVGISTIVFHARLEWRYAYDEIVEFFKDRQGYTTSDDIKRSIRAYSKAKELFEKRNNKGRANDYSKGIMILSEETKEPKDACIVVQTFVFLSPTLLFYLLTSALKIWNRRTKKQLDLA